MLFLSATSRSSFKLSLLKLEHFEILGKITHKEMILDSLIDDDECFTQIKEYFNLSEVKITDNDLERTLKEMVEEGYISINFKWQNEHDEHPYSLTKKGRKVWEEKKKYLTFYYLVN